jgi:3-hydroxyisobutyrate dehydrogenase-like beta-hydroxyacid dehydrogenase
MTRITILGLGTMGSGVAGRLADANNAFTLWNRTPGVHEDLSSRTNVEIADSIAAAVSDADVVLSFLTDDNASREVWAVAFAHCAPATLVVECSTVSPERAEEFVAEATAAGYSAVVALMVGSKPQAESGTLTFLTGGDAPAAATVATLLDPASSSVRHAGSPRSAAILKLLINTLLATQLATMATLKNVTESAGMANALDLVTDIPAFSPLAVGLLARMRSGDFSPNFSVDLIEKDLGYMVQLAHDLQVDPEVVTAVRSVFARASAEGLGDQDFSIVGG